jgi:hypothetical protein
LSLLFWRGAKCKKNSNDKRYRARSSPYRLRPGCQRARRGAETPAAKANAHGYAQAARRAGADRVEIVDGKIVITLVGKTATGTDPAPAGANEWDDVLPGSDHGAH